MKRLFAIVAIVICLGVCASYADDSVLKPQTRAYKVRFNMFASGSTGPVEFWVRDKLKNDAEILHATLKTDSEDAYATATATSKNQFEKPKTSIHIKAIGTFKGKPRTNCYDTSTETDGALLHVYIVNDGGKPC